jgi:hypothetical protein
MGLQDASARVGVTGLFPCVFSVAPELVTRYPVVTAYVSDKLAVRDAVEDISVCLGV